MAEKQPELNDKETLSELNKLFIREGAGLEDNEFGFEHHREEKMMRSLNIEN